MYEFFVLQVLQFIKSMDPDPYRYMGLNQDFWLDPNLDLHKKNADPQRNRVWDPHSFNPDPDLDPA